MQYLYEYYYHTKLKLLTAILMNFVNIGLFAYLHFTIKISSIHTLITFLKPKLNKLSHLFSNASILLRYCALE